MAWAHGLFGGAHDASLQYYAKALVFSDANAGSIQWIVDTLSLASPGVASASYHRVAPGHVYLRIEVAGHNFRASSVGRWLRRCMLSMVVLADIDWVYASSGRPLPDAPWWAAGEIERRKAATYGRRVCLTTER